MSPTQFQSWMQRAFLSVEGTLALELLTPSRLCITEELIRTAMIRGLAAAEPTEAIRIRTEETVSWSSGPCWAGTGKKPGQGRPIQHDIYIDPANGDKGLACEVKWLKNENADQLITDIWKLALSRGCDSERSSLRTYLLVGGEREAIKRSINVLYNHRPQLVDLPRQRTRGALPRRKQFSLTRWLGTKKGQKALKGLLQWGLPVTFREPPAIRDKFYVYTRATWIRPRDVTIVLPSGGTLTWNAVLWEISAEGFNDAAPVDWSIWKGTLLE